MITTAVILSVLVLPLIGLIFFRLYENQLVRQTESELIAQAGSGRRVVLAADGGIREHTVPLLRGAGAETVVLGSLAFGAPDLAARMAWLHAL